MRSRRRARGSSASGVWSTPPRVPSASSAAWFGCGFGLGFGFGFGFGRVRADPNPNHGQQRRLRLGELRVRGRGRDGRGGAGCGSDRGGGTGVLVRWRHEGCDGRVVDRQRGEGVDVPEVGELLREGLYVAQQPRQLLAWLG